MFKTTILILSLLALSCMASTQLNMGEMSSLWSTWKSLYDKAFSLKEETARFAIFMENYKKIISFNGEKNGVQLGLNQFSDLTAEEFKAKYTGGYLAKPREEERKSLRGNVARVDFGLLNLPDSVDWREKGGVIPPKNQGQCGSCWAFGTVGALESFYFINNGELLSFSEQQIVDCDTAGQDQGCNGGLPEEAFIYTAKYGLETEDDYPYTAADGKCKYDASKAKKVNNGHKSITTKDVNAMKAALVVQPVAIGIEADQMVFQSYRNGVIKGSQCGDNLDHAVLAVGYTQVDGQEAFIVKNSWGSTWGDKGYVYISTDGSVNSHMGVCGILGDPTVPTL